MNNIQICKPQPIYVIAESIYNVQGIPQIANTVGPELKKVYRRVAQVCAEEEVFFNGKNLNRPPNFRELFLEYITSGKQITTVPTGRREFLLVYSGFHNLFRPFTQLSVLPDRVTREYAIAPPIGSFIYGSDPIPQIKLYGSSTVIFTSPGGVDPPVAVAIYDARSDKLEIPSPTERETVIRQLMFSK